MIRLAYDFLAVVQGAAVLAVLVLLLLGAFRKFWVLSLYAACVFAGTVGLTLFDLRRTPSQHVLYGHLYWINEVILDLLLFLVVILLTHQVTPEGPLRRKIDRLLIIIAAAVLAIPFLALHPHFTPWPTGKWFNSTGQILNFGAAVMNLGFWGALVASRERDPQFLRIGAGLGIRLAGTAISYGIRHFSHSNASDILPNLFLMLTQLSGWGILCWAFWPANKKRNAVETPVVSQ